MRTRSAALALAAILGCARSAPDVAPPIAAEDEQRALVERRPFLALELARAAIEAGDLAAAARQLDAHVRLAPRADDERVDVALMVACWRGDDEALARATRATVEQCPRVDEEVRRLPPRRAVEPMCFGRGPTPWGVATRLDSEACRATIGATYAALDGA